MSLGGTPSPPETFLPLLADAAPRFGLDLSDLARRRLAEYLALLDAARRQTNLTGPSGVGELVHHALESALGGPLIPPGAAVLDVGSGAGLPGIPIAIVRPDTRVTLLEPRRLRAEFLRRTVEELGASNLEVVPRQLEAYSRRVPARFQTATSRAVGSLPEIVDGAPFLAEGGLLLAWTTSPETLAASLAGAFSLSRAVRVPLTSRKAIAVLVKRPAKS